MAILEVQHLKKYFPAFTQWLMFLSPLKKARPSVW